MKMKKKEKQLLLEKKGFIMLQAIKNFFGFCKLCFCKMKTKKICKFVQTFVHDAFHTQ